MTREKMINELNSEIREDFVVWTRKFKEQRIVITKIDDIEFEGARDQGLSSEILREMYNNWQEYKKVVISENAEYFKDWLIEEKYDEYPGDDEE